MRFEAHPLRTTRFVSHETRNGETQTGLSCMGEPQKVSVALTSRASALDPATQSTAPPYE